MPIESRHSRLREARMLRNPRRLEMPPGTSSKQALNNLSRMPKINSRKKPRLVTMFLETLVRKKKMIDLLNNILSF